MHRSIGLALVSMLFAALAPVSPAKADNHMPWDQPGSTWVGTIDIDRALTYTRNYSDGPVREEHKGRARLTDLQSLGSSSDGFYEAHVAASGTWDKYEPCLETHGRWSADVHTSTLTYFSAYAFSLHTNDDGATQFYPTWYDDIDYTRSGCNGFSDSGTISPPNSQVLWLGHGEGAAAFPAPVLPDQDPNPLHLVGTKTWTLADPPFPLYEEITGYTYTVTYDLWLVTDCTIETAPTSTDTDGDRLPDSYETDLVGSDPANPDSDGDCFSDSREVASGSSPLDRAETPDTLPAGSAPTNVVGQGEAGITCGRTKFRWVTPAMKSLGVAKGKRGCIMLLSNDAVNSIIDFVLENDKATITTALVAFNRAHLGEILDQKLLDWAEEDRRDRKLEFAQREIKKAILKALNLTAVNNVFRAGKLAALAGIPLGALWGLNQVRNNNACLQVRIGPSSTGELKLSWSLAYSKENLTEEGIADGLHKAKVWKKKVVNNGFDKAVAKPLNLRCEFGKVVASGTGASKVFDNPLSFLF